VSLAQWFPLKDDGELGLGGLILACS